MRSGKIFDLLNQRKKLRCLEDNRNNRGVCIMGLSQWNVASADALMRKIDEGMRLRSTGARCLAASLQRLHVC